MSLPSRLVRLATAAARDAVATATLSCATGALVLLAVGRIDAGPSGWVEALAWAAGAGALWGLLAWPAALLWRAVAGDFAKADASSTTAGLGLALAAIEVAAAVAAADWARDHVTSRAVAIGVSGLVVGAVVVSAVRRVGLSSRARRIAMAAPALTPIAIWVALPEHVRAHDGVDWICILAALAPYAVAVPIRRGRDVAIVGLAFAAAIVFALRFGARPGLRAAVERELAPVAIVAARAQGTFDFDGDGVSAWFGGGDCAPWDGRAAPGRAEIAANGIDDNCVAGDLADDTLPTPTPSTAPPPQTRPRNVIVICVDALRPDRMSTYGYERPTTPQLDAIAQRAFVFERAYAEAASTRDTLPSLLSGRSRFELWWYRHRNATLDPRERLLPHQLAAQGLRTIGVLPLDVLNMMGTTRLGFGDVHAYDGGRPRTADLVNRLALEAIDATTTPFFAYVHYYEPHEPYVRHGTLQSVSPEAYDQEVAAVDRAIGRLWTQLAERGLLETTVVVVTADHGEAFGEHGHRFHNAAAYEEDLRVPLLVVVPEADGRRIARPVSNTAVAATLLELLGVPVAAPTAPTAASLWPVMTGADPPLAPVFAVARPDLDHERFAYLEGDAKVIFDRTLTSLEVYDLQADPGETDNRLASDPAFADPLIDRAAAYFDRVVGGAQSRRRAEMAAPQLPDDATAFAPAVDAAPGLRAEAAVAWLVDEIDVYGPMATRVLVRTWFRRTDATPTPFDYDVSLHRDGRVLAHADGPPWRGLYDASAWAPGDLVEDTRVFKVYPKHRDARVTVTVGDTTLDLGRIDELAVAP